MDSAGELTEGLVLSLASVILCMMDCFTSLFGTHLKLSLQTGFYIPIDIL